MKSKTAILTDSTAYIPDNLLRELDIHTIPLIVNWNDQTYLDNVDIHPNEFYNRLSNEKNLPTTSQPSAGAFKAKYEELAKEYDGIVAILISGGIIHNRDLPLLYTRRRIGYIVVVLFRMKNRHKSVTWPE